MITSLRFSRFSIEIATAVTGLALALAIPVAAQENNPEKSGNWTKKLQEDGPRSELSDLHERVRGDSGKWNDDPVLQHATGLKERPAGISLDDWADRQSDSPDRVAADQVNWLIFRTLQLNDNDRVWVDTIRRRGSHFEVEVVQAKWEGKYRKNFTYYQVLAVNLGQLKRGRYTATLTVEPATFTQFDDPKNRNENWPVGERPIEASAEDLHVEFEVSD